MVWCAAGFLLYRYALSVGWVRQATKRRGPRVVNMQTADSADQSQWLKVPPVHLPTWLSLGLFRVPERP